jgi:uncharacterized protein (DUF2062 family)
MNGSEKLSHWDRARLDRPRNLLAQQLGRGLQSRNLALALALGVTIGLVPSVWGASLLCCFLAACFGLNQAVVQLANYLVYPLQIMLLVPYFKLGNNLFSGPNLSGNLTALPALLRSAPLETVDRFWQANLRAIAVWLLTAPLLLGVSYILALKLIQWLNRCGEGKKRIFTLI